MNMFSGNNEKKVPKSLKECYASNQITDNLWFWCERLEIWGKRFFVFLLIIGVILSVVNSIKVEEVLAGRIYTYTDTKVSFDIMTLGSSLIKWVLYAFIEYCVYHIIALLVASLAMIVHNTNVTANINLYKAAKDEGYVEKEEASILSRPVGAKDRRIGDSWDCKKCGTKNPSDSIYCKDCGEYR